MDLPRYGFALRMPHARELFYERLSTKEQTPPVTTRIVTPNSDCTGRRPYDAPFNSNAAPAGAGESPALRTVPMYERPSFMDRSRLINQLALVPVLAAS